MKWISVEEKLPANDVAILGARFFRHKNHPLGSMCFLEIVRRYNNGWVYDHDGELIYPKEGIITHWMPLPDAPEDSIISN